MCFRSLSSLVLKLFKVAEKVDRIRTGYYIVLYTGNRKVCPRQLFQTWNFGGSLVHSFLIYSPDGININERGEEFDGIG